MHTMENVFIVQRETSYNMPPQCHGKTLLCRQQGDDSIICLVTNVEGEVSRSDYKRPNKMMVLESRLLDLGDDTWELPLHPTKMASSSPSVPLTVRDVQDSPPRAAGSDSVYIFTCLAASASLSEVCRTMRSLLEASLAGTSSYFRSAMTSGISHPAGTVASFKDRGFLTACTMPTSGDGLGSILCAFSPLMSCIQCPSRSWQLLITT